MTTKEFESYARSIALNTIKFENGKIDGKELIQAMKVILGKDIFDETAKIMEETSDNNRGGEANE